MPSTEAIAQLKIESPRGPIEIRASEQGLVRVRWTAEARSLEGPAAAAQHCRRAAEQLRAYLARELRDFDLDLAPPGSDFQHRAWRQMARIPYGSTQTYGELAAACGVPEGAQAIGAACGANPIPMIVPCHRVLASGHLGGFAYGLATKRWLLELEETRGVPRLLFDL